MSKNNLIVDKENKKFTMWRIIDAPREKLWEAFTSPELIPQWWGPRNTKTVVDKMDVKPGGAWRYVNDGSAFRGEYKEVIAPEKLVYTFEFEPMAGHISTETVTLEAQPDGKTKVATSTVFDTVEDLNFMVESGMEKGATETWDRLEELATKK